MKENKKIPTYEEIMAMFAESAKKSAEFEKIREKDNAEWRARWKEQQKSFEEQRKSLEEHRRSSEEQRKSLEVQQKSLDKLNEIVNGSSKNIGYHAEQYFQNVLSEKLEFGGEKYDKMYKNFRHNGKETCEFDILMVNGKSVALIEAKNRIHPSDVETVAVKKVAQFRKFFPEYKDYKLYLGIAGFSFDDIVIKEAKERGIGILRQVGDSVEMDNNKLKVY